MPDYDRLRDRAYDLIAANGKPVTITRRVRGAFDPETDAFASDSESSQSAYAVTENASGLRFLGAALTLETRDTAHVAARGLKFEPEAGHEIEIDSVVRKIVNVSRVAPGPVAILFSCKYEGGKT